MSYAHRYLQLCVSFVLALALLQPATVSAQDAGQSKLDEATELKLNASSIEDLGKVIELCEQAIKSGLDDVGTQIAKNIIAASALQRAQLNRANLPRVANNPNAVRRRLQLLNSDLDKAIENNPKLAEALMMKAEIELLTGGTRESALELVNKAIEATADKPEDQAKAYILRAGLGTDLDSQLSDLSEAIKRNPGNVDAWQAKIALLVRNKRFEEAAADALKLMDKDKGNDIAFTAAVEAFVRLKRFDEAIKLATQRIDANPEVGDNYRLRGRIFIEADKNQEAMADLNKAIELNKRDFEALLSRGQLFLAMNEPDKANRDVSDALLIEPDSVQGVLMRSILAAQEKRFADAIRDMELLVRVAPQNQPWILQLASYYQADDRPRLAIELLDKVIERDKNAWRALRLRGDCKLSISEHVQAIDDYRNAIKLMESTKDVPEAEQATDLDLSGLYNNLSWVLSTSPDDKLRNGKEALELGLKAAEVTQYKQAHILSTLAAAYAETADFAKAQEWAEKAVEIGKAEQSEQLEQLQKELESYKAGKPWREKQSTEENAKPFAVGEAIDT
jgi:tetratricopeptide (TPR) repeat protein